MLRSFGNVFFNRYISLALVRASQPKQGSKTKRSYDWERRQQQHKKLRKAHSVTISETAKTRDNKKKREWCALNSVRPLPPQVVVIHGGQVVVDERHGVYHLGADGCGHGRVHRPSEHLARSYRQDRPYAFASSHEGVPHCLAYLQWVGGGGGISNSKNHRKCYLSHNAYRSLNMSTRSTQQQRNHGSGRPKMEHIKVDNTNANI